MNLTSRSDGDLMMENTNSVIVHVREVTEQEIHLLEMTVTVTKVIDIQTRVDHQDVNTKQRNRVTIVGMILIRALMVKKK
jgi:hypothetical protein